MFANSFQIPPVASPSALHLNKLIRKSSFPSFGISSKFEPCKSWSASLTPHPAPPPNYNRSKACLLSLQFLKPLSDLLGSLQNFPQKVSFIVRPSNEPFTPSQCVCSDAKSLHRSQVLGGIRPAFVSWSQHGCSGSHSAVKMRDLWNNSHSSFTKHLSTCKSWLLLWFFLLLPAYVQRVLSFSGSDVRLTPEHVTKASSFPCSEHNS